MDTASKLCRDFFFMKVCRCESFLLAIVVEI